MSAACSQDFPVIAIRQSTIPSSLDRDASATYILCRQTDDAIGCSERSLQGAISPTMKNRSLIALANLCVDVEILIEKLNDFVVRRAHSLKT